MFNLILIFSRIFPEFEIFQSFPEFDVLFQSSPPLSGCTRYDDYLKYVDGNKLAEEATTFGLEFKSKLGIPVSEQALRTAIQLAKEKAL